MSLSGANIDLFEKLQAVFPISDIEWRVLQAGENNGNIWAIVAPYVTNRAIMERLDSVMGPENWQNDFKPGPDGGVSCGVSLKISNEWITKWDGAENTKIEPVKGGHSDAMKRAAVQWGIGRYLYKIPGPLYAIIDEKGDYYQKKGKIPSFNWNPPGLPHWAVPEEDQPKVYNPNEQEVAIMKEAIDYYTSMDQPKNAKKYRDRLDSGNRNEIKEAVAFFKSVKNGRDNV